MPSRSRAPRPQVAWLREALVAAGRRLGGRGLIGAGEGNASVRLPDGALLVTPAGRRKDELRAGDIVRVAGRSTAAADKPRGKGLRPSSDLAIHHAVYAARPDVHAVAHAHLPAAMALTLAGVVPDPAALPETALLLPRLPFVPFGEPGSEDLAARIAAALVEGPPFPGAALLERHGAVAVGGSIEEAVDRLELVEILCRTWRDALLIRAANGRGREAILRRPSPRPGPSARGRARRES